MELDPEGQELKALARHVDLRGRRVLEIGSGDGRLTRRYATLPALLVCRDPDEQAVRAARGTVPAVWAARGTVPAALGVARVQALDLASEAFDTVLFSWSL